MMRTIITALIVFFVVIVVISFFITGLPALTTTEDGGVSTLINPLSLLSGSTTPEGAPLPLFPITDFPTIEISDSLEGGFGNEVVLSSGGGINTPLIGDELVEIEREYDYLDEEIAEARVFGEPSPYRDQITINTSFSGAISANPNLEYVLISSSILNPTPINISGWSLQSLVTGVRIRLPQGVHTYETVRQNEFNDIYLDPGQEAVITTGSSPVGVSFRESSCTGFLDQFQTFVPRLNDSCPAPYEELPATPENIVLYGDACLDFVGELASCEYYLEGFPPNISPACQLFVQNALTYTSCVDRHRWRPSFSEGNWRIFLNQPRHLWRDTRDVIRLLDENGRTVDAWSY